METKKEIIHPRGGGRRSDTNPMVACEKTRCLLNVDGRCVCHSRANGVCERMIEKK